MCGWTMRVSMILLSRVSAIGVMLAGGIALQPARAADADDGVGRRRKQKFVRQPIGNRV